MKMKKMQIWLGVLLAAAMITGCLSGCGGQSGDQERQGEKGGEEKEEIVKLDYWFPVGSMIPNDLRDVQEELNKIVRQEINAEVQLHAVGIADYESTMSLKVNAGDEFDICYTCPWLNNYADNVRLGAFVPLDDMLEEYAPTIYATIEPQYWDAARIDGKIYGVINRQIIPRQACISLDREMVEASKFDYTKVQSYEDLEPFLQFCLEQGKNDICEMFAVQAMLPYFGWDDMGGSYKIPGFVYAEDGTGTVFNQYESEEWKSMMALGASWYKKGYFKEDILTSYTNVRTICLRMPDTYKPGIEAEELQYTGREFVVQPLGEAMTYGSWVIGTMNAVSQTSKHPEKALQFLELLYSNEEAFNLLIFGIEGIHYNKLGDKRVEIIEDGGYSMPIGWEFGDQFNQWLQPSQADEIWKETQKINESTPYSVIYGFSFDPTAVKTEIANCIAVYDAYYMPLLLGLYEDTDAKYQEFLDKLETAGASRIIEEKQRQLDEWKAANNDK